jgi:hypothetical protein
MSGKSAQTEELENRMSSFTCCFVLFFGDFVVFLPDDVRVFFEMVLMFGISLAGV